MALRIIGGKDYDPFALDDTDELLEIYGIRKGTGNLGERYIFRAEEKHGSVMQGIIERGRTPFNNSSEIMRHCMIVGIDSILAIEGDWEAIQEYKEVMADIQRDRREARMQMRKELIESYGLALEQAKEAGDLATFEEHVMAARELYKILPAPWNDKLGEKLDHYKPGWRGPDRIDKG